MKKISELTDAEIQATIERTLGYRAWPMTWEFIGPLLEELAVKADKISDPYCFYFDNVNTDNMKRSICESYLRWKLQSNEVEV